MKTLVLLAVFAGLLLAGCLGEGSTTGSVIRTKAEAPVLQSLDLVGTTNGGTSWAWEPSTIAVKKGKVRLHLSVPADDVTHGFSLVEFGVSQIVKPGESVVVEFVADKAGEFTYYCFVACGKGHREMVGKLVVAE